MSLKFQKLLFCTAFLSLLIMCLSNFGCSKSSEKDVTEKKDSEQPKKAQQLQIVDGRYISTEDSLAGIEIRDDTYIMFYKGYEKDSKVYEPVSSRYEMIITDTIAFRDTTYRNGKYLTLKDEDKILKYAIDYWKEDYISLIYLPRGNFLNYKRKEQK